MFLTVPLSITSSFSLYTEQWYMSYRSADSLRAVPSWSCSQAVSKPLWHIPLQCVHWRTPDDGQRNCPKHVGFYSKNKFWKISASSWFHYKNLSRYTVTWTSKTWDSQYWPPELTHLQGTRQRLQNFRSHVIDTESQNKNIFFLSDSTHLGPSKPLSPDDRTRSIFWMKDYRENLKN